MKNEVGDNIKYGGEGGGKEEKKQVYSEAPQAMLGSK